MTPEELWGRATVHIAGTDFSIPRNHRYAFVDPTSSGVDVSLPDATKLQVGHHVWVTNRGSLSLTISVLDAAGGTIISSLAAGATLFCILQTPGTTAGTWSSWIDGSVATNGLFIPDTREFFSINLTGDPPDSQEGIPLLLDVNIRDMVDAQGYTGVNPARVSVRVLPGMVVSSNSINRAAFASGTFPPFSTLFIDVEGGIFGRGGDGGKGGNNTGTVEATNGTDGGLAMKLDVLTILNIDSSGARIAGGGGGGGGGSYVTSGTPGEGGGGGGGFPRGKGGISDGGGASPGQNATFGFGPGFPGAPNFGSAGLGGAGEPGTDAFSVKGGNGAQPFSLGAGTAGASGGSGDGTPGAGGNTGDAIHHSFPLYVIGEQGLNAIVTPIVPKLGSTITVSVTPSGLLVDGT